MPHRLLRASARFGPGLIVAVGLAMADRLICVLIGSRILGFDPSPRSPVMLAIPLGLVLGNLMRVPDWAKPGLKLSSKRVLRVGIVLMGLRLSALELARYGRTELSIIIVTVTVAILVTTLAGQMFGLPRRLGILTSQKWQFLLQAAKWTTSFMSVAALAAVGISTNLNSIRCLGFAPLVAGTIADLAVGATGYVMIGLLG